MPNSDATSPEAKMQIKPAQTQPLQIDLFGMVSGSRYVNLVPSYDALPRFVPGSGRAKRIKRNEDGTMPPIRRSFIYDKKPYSLMIQPAYLKDADGKDKAYRPRVREERIELALLKLAVGDMFLNINEDGHHANYSIALATTPYAIQKALSNKYSKAEIKQGLDILSLVRFKVEGPGRNETFSPIDTIHQVDADRIDHLFIRFNSLVTRDVVAQMWRQIDYAALLDDPDYLSRWFRRRLGMKFAHAEKGSEQWRFHLNLSTIINEAGLSDYKKMSDAHRYVCRVLDGLGGIVDHYTVTKKFEAGRTGGRILVDVKYRFFPTIAFAQEQKKLNQHALTLKLKAESGQ